MKLEHSLRPYTKINTKWIKAQSVRADNIKLLEENIGRTLYDINHSKILFDSAPREMEIKTKINKWDLMKLKSFCTAKETINKTKRQPIEWEKIFANHVSDIGLIIRIYRELPKLNNTKTKTQFKSGQRIQTFLQKKIIQIANKHMKGCSTSLIIREMQIKTTMRLSPHTRQNGHHQKNLQTINAGESVEKKEPSCTVGANVN